MTAQDTNPRRDRRPGPGRGAASLEIGLVRYPGVQQAAVLGMTDLFLYANEVAAELRQRQQVLGPGTGASRRFRVTHWESGASADGRPRAVYDSAPGSACRPRVLVLPPSLQPPIGREPAAPYAAWLVRQHAGGATLASICAGVFVLGETGLLAGRRITTNWLYGEVCATRFPGVSVRTDQLIVDDGDIITAGGVMAWTDLGMLLIDRFLGSPVMIETARRFVLDPPRREQRYYSAFSPRLDHGDTAVLAAQRWLQGHAGEEVDLAELAGRAGLEPRTFQRRFRRATGLTTTRYRQRLRIGRAQELLQLGHLPIDRIAWEIGYGDPGAFRKVFSDIVGLTPGEYRRRFEAGSEAIRTTAP